MANANLFLFADNVGSLAASPIVIADTTIVLDDASSFPVPSAGQQLAVTIEDTSGNIEVVYCTGITSNTLTVARAQEGTSARNFNSGSNVEMRVTSGMLASFLQKNGGDTLTNTTDVSGVIDLGSGGSIQGGEYAGGAVRGAPGATSNQFVVPSGGGAPTIGGSAVLTTANLAATLPSGYGLISSGMVLMWNGASNAIPAGYVLCDGTNSTPNLEDQFVIGAGNTYSLGDNGGSASAVTGSTNPIGSASVASHVLTVTEMPSHGHDFGTGNAGTYVSGGTGSGFSLNLAGSYQTITNYPAGQTVGGHPIVADTGGGGGHTHALSGSLAHTHSITLPPYYALFMIMKT